MTIAVVVGIFSLCYFLPSGILDEWYSEEFMPSGSCYLWRSDILWLHVGSDVLVALSYFTIPVCIVLWVRRKKELKFHGVFWLFSLFLLFCGLSHFFEVYSVWHGAYRLTGMVKLATAIVSVSTAIYLARSMPKLCKLPLRQDLQEVEHKLSERELLFDAILSDGLEAFVTVKPIQSEVGELERFEVDEFNRIAAREMAIDPDIACGKSIEDVFSFSAQSGLVETILESHRDGKAQHREVELDLGGGQARWLNIKVVPAGSRLAIFFMDISKERQTDKQLKQALEERVEAALKERDINAARAQAAMSAATHGILVVDDRGRIVQCNTELLRFFGYEESELAGQSVEMLVPMEGRARHSKHMKKFGEHPERRPMGKRMQLLSGQRKDGTTFPVEIGLNPFETPEGKFVCASVLDLTERLEAQRALEESELRLQQATNGGNVGIWHWLDVSKDEVYWSPKMYEFIGYRPDEIESTYESFKNLLHPDDLKSTLAALKECFGEKASYEHDHRLLTKNDGYRWFCSAGILLRDEEGSAARMVGSIQDIQKRKDHEEEIELINKALELKNREMEEMSYAVSHDLKAPLVSIQGLISLVLKGGYTLDEDTKTIFERVEKAARNMQSLINDMLEMSRVGNAAEALERIEVRSILVEVCELFEGKIKLSHCHLEIDDVFPTLVTQKMLFRQAVQNLVTNALKYGCGGESPTVRIYSRSEQGHVDIVVEDNGKGIPEKDREAVFKLFRRLESGADGSGLGLAIVAKVMGTLNGKAFVESHDGPGARFVLRFPNSGKVDEASTTTEEAIVAAGPKMIFSDQDELSGIPSPSIDISEHFQKFVYATAHDFNAPLVTIKGHLDFLQEHGAELLAPDSRKLLEQSSKAANRMSEYLEALVKFGEAILGKDQQTPVAVDADALLREVVEDMRKSGALLETSVVYSKLPKIECLSADLLKTLFENLLGNAAQFAASSDNPEAKIKLNETNTHWAFSIQDNGPGMAESDALAAFTPFGRLGVQDVNQGGIGLATCKLIVELHGGQIWIDPDYKKGVKVHFTLKKEFSKK